MRCVQTGIPSSAPPLLPCSSAEIMLSRSSNSSSLRYKASEGDIAKLLRSVQYYYKQQQQMSAVYFSCNMFWCTINTYSTTYKCLFSASIRPVFQDVCHKQLHQHLFLPTLIGRSMVASTTCTHIAQSCLFTTCFNMVI